MLYIYDVCWQISKSAGTTLTNTIAVAYVTHGDVEEIEELEEPGKLGHGRWRGLHQAATEKCSKGVWFHLGFRGITLVIRSEVGSGLQRAMPRGEGRNITLRSMAGSTTHLPSGSNLPSFVIHQKRRKAIGSFEECIAEGAKEKR